MNGSRTCRAALALLALTLPTGAQDPLDPAIERWEVPDFSGAIVLEVQEYWDMEAGGLVTVRVAEEGGSLRTPGPNDEDREVDQNAETSAPGSFVDPGGTVGVILVPMGRPQLVLVIVGVVLLILVALGGALVLNQKTR